MKPPPFQYECPSDIEEAVSIVAQAGYGGKVLAGGQSLVPMLNMRLAYPDVLVDLRRVDALNHLTVDDGRVRVGAMVTQAELGRSSIAQAEIPLAVRCIPFIGHYVTRNRGTVGGSLAHSDPRAELPVALVALNGSVTVASANGRREIQSTDLFRTHFTTSMREDEILVESSWPILGSKWGFSFAEFALRHGDYALAMVACAVHVEDDLVTDARMVAGSISDRPIVLDEVAESLRGQHPDPSTYGRARELAMQLVEPSSDVHATGTYKRHLTGVMLERALLEACSEAVGLANG